MTRTENASRILALWACLVACLPGPARADTAQAIVLAAPDRSTGIATVALADAVRGQLAELGVTVVLAPPLDSSSIEAATAYAAVLASRHRALAVFWLAAQRGELVIHLYEPKGPHLRARSFAVSGAESAAAEEVAVVIRSATSALLEGTEVSMPEIALPPPPPVLRPPPPPPPPPPAPPPPPSWSLRAALGYVGTLYASKEPWQSGATGVLSLRPGAGPWLVEVGYAYFPALVVDRAGAHLRVYRHPIEVGIGLEQSLGRAVLATELAGLAEWSWHPTARAEPPLEPLPAQGRWQWGLRTRARGGWTLGRGWQLFAAVGADFMLYHFDYVTEDPAKRTVLSPLPARPRLETGVMARLW